MTEDIKIRGFTLCQECEEFVPNNEYNFFEEMCTSCLEEVIDGIEWEEKNSEEIHECLLEEEDERRAECTCGAYALSEKTGHYVQVADCIC